MGDQGDERFRTFLDLIKGCSISDSITGEKLTQDDLMKEVTMELLSRTPPNFKNLPRTRSFDMSRMYKCTEWLGVVVPWQRMRALKKGLLLEYDTFFQKCIDEVSGQLTWDQITRRLVKETIDLNHSGGISV